MNLSPTQQKIVQHNEGALLVVAGPGSGKTRVLTERIRRLFAEAEGHFHILALTFTNKAANEMRERLETIPDIHQRAFIGTLHSFCTEVLSNRGKAVGIEGSPHIFENFQDRKQVLREAMQADPELASELRSKGDAHAQDKALWQWLNAISEAKRQLLLAEAVPDVLLAKIYAAYDEGLRHSNALDYDDLLLLAYRLFIERPKIAGFYRRLYRYICIDEAQDLNEAQYRVLQALCGEEYRDVILVGDPKQAIFQWNGANPKYLDLFERDFMAAKVCMQENYRSAAAIIELARQSNSTYQPEGNYPIRGEISLLNGQNEEEEAEQVLAYLEHLLEKGHPDIEGQITLERCAVLARNRYVFNALEKQLRDKNYLYYKALSTQHESESILLQDFELCLRLLSNPRDRLHLNTLLQRWQLDKTFLDEMPTIDCVTLIQFIEPRINSPEQHAILQAIQAIGLTQESFQFLKGMDVLQTFVEKAKLDNNAKALCCKDIELCCKDIEQWRTYWDVYLRNQTGEPTLRAFMAQVALGGTQRTQQAGLGLLTVHAAKGSEFDVVVIMGMMEGIFPDYRAVSDADLEEEEKRNFFVAITRAKRLLCFSYADKRKMPGGDSKLKLQKPSRFLPKLNT